MCTRSKTRMENSTASIDVKGTGPVDERRYISWLKQMKNCLNRLFETNYHGKGKIVANNLDGTNIVNIM